MKTTKTVISAMKKPVFAVLISVFILLVQGSELARSYAIPGSGSRQFMRL
jgi:hypothetical protein